MGKLRCLGFATKEIFRQNLLNDLEVKFPFAQNMSDRWEHWRDMWIKFEQTHPQTTLRSSRKNLRLKGSSKVSHSYFTMLIFCYICLHNAGIKTTRHKFWREIISYKKSYKYENIQRYIFALIHKNCHKVLNCSLCMFPVSRGWTLETSLDNASTDLFWERAKARSAESSNDGSRIPGTPRMQSLPRLPGKWGIENLE